MSLTLAEKAARITCVACAVATDRVHVTELSEQITVQPPNLLNLTFQSVNISADQQIETFKKAACELLPLNQKGRKDIQATVMAQAIDPKKRIQLFSDFLEALMAQQVAA